MAVIKVEKNGNYTVMSNVHLDDRRLSLKAAGLLSKMLRLPPDWDYTVAGLTAICKDGRAAVTSALKELEACGYLIREQSHNEAGHFAANDYTVYESPVSHPPLAENLPTVGEPSSPLAGFPLTENPLTENQQQINNNITNYESTNPPKAPRRGRSAKKQPDYEPEMFSRFWAAYPRGEDKQGAIREWDTLRPDRELMFEMSAALSRQKASEDWQRGIGIPYAVRWLKNRRWEDEAAQTVITPTQSSYWAPDPEVM